MTKAENITPLIVEELKRANGIYDYFNSSHEAYGVIKEEIEEAEIEMKKCKETLEVIWLRVKSNINYNEEINQLKQASIALIQEAIQVAAMCEKTIISIKKMK